MGSIGASARLASAARTDESFDRQAASTLTLRELGLVVAGFTAATLVLTLPLAIHPTRFLPSDLVDTLLNTWILGWDAERLRHGLRGVWDAPIYHPYRNTLAFSENLLGIAFLAAPVYWISGSPVLTYNAAFLFSFILAGVGMYLLVRSLARDALAATIAGVFYAFCPFRMAQIAHVQMVATGWIPIALWGLHQYFDTARRPWLAVFAGGWVLQALSNTYVAYFIAIPVALVAAEGWLRNRGSRARTALDLTLAFGLVVVVLAPVGLQYYRVRTNYQQVRSPQEIADGGADLRSYLVGKDSIGIGRWLPTAVASDPEKELFAGVFAFVFAGVAIAAALRGRRSPLARWTWLYGSIALAGVLLSLGPTVHVWGHVVTTNGPYRWLLRTIPGMDGMRVPARFAIVYFAALSVLIGFGAFSVCRRFRIAARPAAGVACLIAVVADGWAVPIPTSRYPAGGRPEDRAAAQWLHDKPPGAVLHLPMLPIPFRELHYQYATLFHGHPLVNGFSGYNTRLQEFFRHMRSPLTDFERFPGAVRMLRALGVRYVVLHTNDYGSQLVDIASTINGLRGSGQMIHEVRLLGTLVFELAPWHEESHDERLVSIGSHEFTASASEAASRLPLAFDGDYDTRWIGGQEQPDAPSKWLTLQFDSPQDVARLELQLADRTTFDLPRDFEVDATDREGRARQLYRETPYAELAWAIVRNPRYPALVFDLPPNETVTLTLRDWSHGDRWWSVHEVRLWRREQGPSRGPAESR